MALNIVETNIVNALSVQAADNVLSKAEHIYDPNYGADKSGTAIPDASKYQDDINQEVWENPKAIEVVDIEGSASTTGYVSYNSQTLSATQKKQARSNIAASAEYFYNLNDDLSTSIYTTKSAAYTAVPEAKRKLGLVITYKATIEGVTEWHEEQYIGTAIDNTSWTTLSNWKDYDGVLAGSIAPAWTQSTAYTVGTSVMYMDQRYICKTAHTSGSTFTASYWEDSDVDSSVTHLYQKVSKLDSSINFMDASILALWNAVFNA